MGISSSRIRRGTPLITLRRSLFLQRCVFAAEALLPDHVDRSRNGGRAPLNTLTTRFSAPVTQTDRM
jgi:hypothetical protein